MLSAYLDALEARQAAGLPLVGIASVASFFLSRIDVKVDKILDAKISTGGSDADIARGLRGHAAIASAGLAYRRLKEVVDGRRWKALKAAGAGMQRLLWASTGTKDALYSDVKYVEALIAHDTVNTLPLETLDAYRDHGKPALRIDRAMEQAPVVMRGLFDLGVDMVAIEQELEHEGIEKFVKPYQSLLESFRRIGMSA